MTFPKDPTLLVEAWLREGPEEAPDRILASVADALGNTMQERRFSRERFGWVGRAAVAALAAATLLLIAFLVTPPRRVDVGNPPTPSPSPSASAGAFGAADVLAFTRAKDLWVSAADGSGAHQLTTDGGVGAASWSPDGTLLAYDLDGALYTLDADGTQREITQDAGPFFAPSWSPDGTQLVATGPGGFVIVTLDGRVREITERSLDLCVSGPDWGPGGDIVFSGNKGCPTGGEPTSLYLIDATADSPRELFGHGTQVLGASWSPDGSTIAFMDTADGGCIYLIDADGTNERRLTSGCTKDFKITWSPDGERVAWAGGARGVANAFVINTDGTNMQAITSLNRVAYLDWRPSDGQ